MKKLQNLGKSLSKNEQKEIAGGVGGTCCWHNAGWVQYGCGLSSGDAQAAATAYALLSGQHGYWCCSNC
ncbi:MAG: hypothetical protein ACKVOW_04310 [Chitinophagaceae bacterium]